MTKKRIDLDLAREKSAFASFSVSEEADPNVVMPADIQATIARGDGAAEMVRKEQCGDTTKDAAPDFNTAVTDQATQDTRDGHLDNLELAARGKRQQPPMINRLRAVMILVERWMADGTPFAVGPNSIMNRKVRAWLNARGAQTTDGSNSRRRQKFLTDGAVRGLLKQIRALR